MHDKSSTRIVRLRSLLRIASEELQYLKRCANRLFAIEMTTKRMAKLTDDDPLSEQVDAFVARFSRLQDTLGDKLLPAFLYAMEERPGAVMENLDRGEKLGLIASADHWLALRKLRNRMIHEYVADPTELSNALVAAREGIVLLEQALTNIKQRLLQQFPDLDVSL